jgi:hypothetical protein
MDACGPLALRFRDLSGNRMNSLKAMAAKAFPTKRNSFDKHKRGYYLLRGIPFDSRRWKCLQLCLYKAYTSDYSHGTEGVRDTWCTLIQGMVRQLEERDIPAVAAL